MNPNVMSPTVRKTNVRLKSLNLCSEVAPADSLLRHCRNLSDAICFRKRVIPSPNPLFFHQISEIYVSGESGDLTAKEKLLLWSQQATEGYPGLRCVNFTSSWSDGRMFNALLHRYRYRFLSTPSNASGC